MKIKYNEIEKSIEIKDGIKTHYFAMKIVLILNLFNAILNLYDVNKTGFGLIETFWVVLGIASIMILYLFMFKKSTLEKIPIKRIKQLKEKSIFGRKKFSIELEDGKKRDLNEVKTQAEYNEVKRMLNENGISC